MKPKRWRAADHRDTIDRSERTWHYAQRQFADLPKPKSVADNFEFVERRDTRGDAAGVAFLNAWINHHKRQGYEVVFDRLEGYTRHVKLRRPRQSPKK